MTRGKLTTGRNQPSAKKNSLPLKNTTQVAFSRIQIPGGQIFVTKLPNYRMAHQRFAVPALVTYMPTAHPEF